MNGINRLVALAVVLVLSAAAFAQPPVRYAVNLDKHFAQLVEIETTIDTKGLDEVTVHMPAWRPGRYVLLDPSGDIRRFEVTDNVGRALPWEKVRRSSWKIETNGAAEITIKHEIFADRLGERTIHVDGEHAFISGVAAFLYTDTYRGEPLEVTVNMPRGWEVATGLEKHPRKRNTWVSPDYDILVDSPIEVGTHTLIEFDVDGTPHEIAIWGSPPEGVELDEDKWVESFSKIVRSQAAMFGEMPYKRYVFLVHAQPGAGGGTEHWNSTIMQTRPSVFTSDRAWDGFLGLVSHEMFHTWNVKRLRPAGITPYDYQNENLTPLLWVSEGTTSYYDDLTLVRTGLTTPRDYIRTIGRSINGYRNNPGRLVQSAEMSSIDSWTRFNRRNADTGNTTISFYTKGAMISLALDMYCRELTRNRVTLDDVMRTLYEEQPLEKDGFSTQEMIEVISRLTGQSAAPFFDRYVRGVEELDLEKALAVVGLSLKLEPEDAEEVADIGLRAFSPRVSSVTPDGPAFNAGIVPDDEIVAINGVKFEGNLGNALEYVEPGDTVTITLFRRNRLLEVEIKAAGRVDADWTVSKLENPTAAQKAAYESWIGSPWDAPARGDRDGADAE
ncbi:MAG: PDZ domain-containing protein [Planctomycetota bacterium]